MQYYRKCMYAQHGSLNGADSNKYANLVLSLRSSVIDDVDIGNSGTIPIQCNKQLVNWGLM